MLAENDRPSLDEQYLLATSTSDLTLNPDRTCAATHLIAAGLVGNRMGEALTHLRSEWQTADKPRKATDDEISARAATLPKAKGKPDVKRARAMLLVEYAAAMRKRAHQLRGWVVAMNLLRGWAAARGVDPDLLSPALYHHLNPVCPVCDGRGKHRLPDAPTLGQTCAYCNGLGESPQPLGAERVRQWLYSCSGKSQEDRKGVLVGRIDSDEIKERKARRPKPPPEDERGAAAVADVASRIMGRKRRT